MGFGHFGYPKSTKSFKILAKTKESVRFCAFWGAWKGVMMQINLKMAQLLSSRLCHDLIGPVVAISGGLELMEEGMEDTAPALELMAKSASQATRRLAFFRIAFGSGAGEGGELSVRRAVPLSKAS